MTTSTARPSLPKLTERHVTEQVIGLLRSRGWICERVQSGLLGETGKKVRVGIKGINDWNCFKGKRYFKLELKAPGKKLSAPQERYFEQAKQANLNIMWADSLSGFLVQFEMFAMDR